MYSTRYAMMPTPKTPQLRRARYLCPDWPAPLGVQAVVTTRGGHGQSFNLADNALSTTASQEVRAQLHNDWALQTPIRWLKQVHGTHMVHFNHAQNTPTADGIWSDQPNQPCAIMTADCLPVLLCSTQGGAVGAAHAGWRGLANGVLDHAVSALNVAPQHIMVWLGPAISQPCFEVGPEVKAAFVQRMAYAEQGFIPSKNPGKWLANLYTLARLRLAQLGVYQVYGGHYCTYRQSDYFYSYRRGNTTERMASVIWWESA